MRKLIVLAMVMAALLVVGVIAFQAIEPATNGATSGTNVNQQEDEAMPTPTAIPSQEPTEKPTAEPTEEPVVEPVATIVYDKNGKAYFVGEPYTAYNMALDFDIQERLDLAEIVDFRVYDIMLESDLPLVDRDDKEVNLVYGIVESELPEEIVILRDGNAIFTWDEENFVLSEKEDKVFLGASDAQFTDKVYCAKHKAINSRVLTGYPHSLEWAEGSRKGVRGPFDLEKLDHQLFKAWLLVERQVELEGEVFNAYTWVVRTCGCRHDGTVSAPTKAPTVKPTQAPTQAPTVAPTQAPTQAPTVAPTQVPTQAPTVAPTQAPTPSFNPEPPVDPTVKPTVAPTPSFNPEPPADPTVKPTVAPTPTFNLAPSADPTVKPTQAPTVKPTQAPAPTFNFEPVADPTVKPTQASTVAPAPTFNFEPASDPTVAPTSSSTEGNFSDEPLGDPSVGGGNTSSGPSFQF